MASSDPSAYNIRRVASEFLPNIPQHPFLDPNFPEEDVPLVPRDLAPHGRLNWELPKEARMNLHIMLKFTEETDKLLDEFHEKVPSIDEVIEEWCEMKGANPTKAVFAKIRAQASHKESSKTKAKNAGEHTDETTDSYIFNMAKNIDSPGRSDLIYLTDAIRDMEDEGRKSGMPENLRAVDWLDFDGSYVHLADAHQAEPETANPESKSWLSVPGPSMRRDSTPTNLRTTEWPMSEQDACISPSIYSPEPEGDSKKAKPLGSFEEFWRDHGGPQGL